MHLLLAIIDALYKVSLRFQDGITISRVQDKFITLSASLKSFKERPSLHLSSFLIELKDASTFNSIELERDQCYPDICGECCYDIHPREV